MHTGKGNKASTCTARIECQLSTTPPQLSYAASHGPTSVAWPPRGSHCTLDQLKLIALHIEDNTNKNNAKKGKDNAKKGKNNAEQAAEA